MMYVSRASYTAHSASLASALASAFPFRRSPGPDRQRNEHRPIRRGGLERQTLPCVRGRPCKTPPDCADGRLRTGSADVIDDTDGAVLSESR